MNKKTIVGVMLILCASLVFSAGLKKGKASPGTKKTEDGHWNVALIKASLQEWNPGPFNLPDETLSNLSELAEKGDGKACRQLARYFYCNGQIDEYIDFIKKGCVLLHTKSLTTVEIRFLASMMKSCVTARNLSNSLKVKMLRHAGIYST